MLSNGEDLKKILRQYTLTHCIPFLVYTINSSRYTEMKFVIYYYITLLLQTLTLLLYKTL